jgi:AraC-like DNA-binding protein
MDLQKLAEDYISAWNRQDVEGVLALMHPGAAYYDAFWRETCVGRDLVRYLHASFEDYTYFYRLVGNVIVTDTGGALRYNAYERSDSEDGDVAFSGLEVLTIRGGKILTVSNHYCDPRQECIIELAELEAARHGESRYANSGLPFHRLTRIKNQLSAAMIQDQLYLDPELTESQLADKFGCSVDDLIQVASIVCKMDLYEHLDQHRARYARDMLREKPGDELDLSHVATQAGFRSYDDFRFAFKESFGETPSEFDRRNTDKSESGNDSILH